MPRLESAALPGIFHAIGNGEISPGLFEWKSMLAERSASLSLRLHQEMALALLILIALLAIGWLLFYWRLRVRTAQLQARMYLRLDESERMARDLHDKLLQGLQGLTLTFQLVSDQLPVENPLRTQINEALAQADRMMEEGLSHLRSLRGMFSAPSDLAAVLRNLCKEMEAVRSIRCTLNVTGQPRSVMPLAKRELLQIALEALTNAFRHSKASAVVMELEYERTALRLTIRDNGLGLPTEVLEQGGREGHFGFSGIRERTRLLKGECRFQNLPQGGCEILVTASAKEVYERRLFWKSHPDR